jgi:hypothetical protein
MRNAVVFVGKPEEKGLLKDLGIDENNIKIIIWRTGWEVCGLDTFHSRCRPVAGYCKHGNETVFL